MKNIPMRPKMTKEETELMQEQFMRGESLPAKPQGNKTVKAQITPCKNNVKMYNLALPIDVHAKAKMFALMEGQSLAEYIINAVRNANDKAAAKYSG